MDLLDPLFSRGLARIRDVIVNLFGGALLLWPAWRVWGLADRARDRGDVTEYLNIPQFYIAYFIALMTFITALALLARGIAFIFAPHLVQKAQAPALDAN